MVVLIATQNQDIIKKYLPKVKFTQSTANTCTFEVSVTQFQKVRDGIRGENINPYSVMYW